MALVLQERRRSTLLRESESGFFLVARCLALALCRRGFEQLLLSTCGIRNGGSSVALSHVATL